MSDLHVTPLWSPCLIIVTVFWHFSRSRATVKSQWALAALFQRIKMNNSFPETTNVLFSRTGPSQSSLLGQLLLLQMAKASSLSSGWLPSVSGPSSGASPFLPQLSQATQPLLDGCIIQTQSWDLMHVFVSCGCASLFQGLLLWIFSLNVILQGFQATKQLCSKNYLASLLPGQHFQIIYTYIHTCTLPVKRLEWFSFFFFNTKLNVWVFEYNVSNHTFISFQLSWTSAWVGSRQQDSSQVLEQSWCVFIIKVKFSGKRWHKEYVHSFDIWDAVLNEHMSATNSPLWTRSESDPAAVEKLEGSI